MKDSKSLFVKFFDVISFTSRLIFSLLFLTSIVITIWFFIQFGKDTKLIINDGSTLVVDINGSVVEQYTQAPFSGLLKQISGGSKVNETRLYDILLALRVAKDDPRISQIYIKADTLESAGFAQLREISEVIKDIKQSGKKVIVFAKTLDQKQYLLSSNANKIYLDPEGSLIIEGLGRYRQYFREGLQDKLGVDVHLFRVGEFKSAAEPFILDGASHESKEADLFWMNDIWGRYISDIATSRNLNPSVLSHQIDNIDVMAEKFNGDMAQIALEQKLVDGLKTQEEMTDVLLENGSKSDKNFDGIVSVNLESYIKDVSSSKVLSMSNDQIAIVVAQGEIVDGLGDMQSVGGDATSELLRNVRDDETVKAVVLRVDSPGGAVFASEQIRREIDLIRKSGRPVVVSMGNMAASGGYWISMNGDTIMADPSTITGSIGIFGLVPDVSRALKRVGVSTDGVGTTPLSGSFDITRPLNPRLGNLIQNIIDNGYDKFISKVSNARNMSEKSVDESARGRVWSGAQAKERGLVDKLGGLQDAISEARSLAGLQTNSPVFFAQNKSNQSLGNILMGIHANAFTSALSEKLGVWSLISSLSSNTDRSSVIMLEQSIKAKPGKAVTTFVHCLCEI